MTGRSKQRDRSYSEHPHRQLTRINTGLDERNELRDVQSELGLQRMIQCHGDTQLVPYRDLQHRTLCVQLVRLPVVTLVTRNENIYGTLVTCIMHT